MATTTLTQKAQNITVPANTDEHDIDFSNVLKSVYGIALITMKTGTAVQFNADGTTIDANSITLASSGNNTKEIIEIERGINLKYKGGAGSETFNINIQSR
jgi:hypothetical protein